MSELEKLGMTARDNCSAAIAGLNGAIEGCEDMNSRLLTVKVHLLRISRDMTREHLSHGSKYTVASIRAIQGPETHFTSIMLECDHEPIAIEDGDRIIITVIKEAGKDHEEQPA